MTYIFQGKELSPNFVQSFGFPDIEELAKNPPEGMTGDQVRQIVTKEYKSLVDEYEGSVSFGVFSDVERMLQTRVATTNAYFDRYEMCGFRLVKMETDRGAEFWATFSQTPVWDSRLLIDRPYRWRDGLKAFLYPASLVPIYQRNRIASGFPVNVLHPTLEVSQGLANQNLLFTVNPASNSRLLVSLSKSTISS